MNESGLLEKRGQKLGLLGNTCKLGLSSRKAVVLLNCEFAWRVLLIFKELFTEVHIPCGFVHFGEVCPEGHIRPEKERTGKDVKAVFENWDRPERMETPNIWR